MIASNFIIYLKQISLLLNLDFSKKGEKIIFLATLIFSPFIYLKSISLLSILYSLNEN